VQRMTLTLCTLPSAHSSLTATVSYTDAAALCLFDVSMHCAVSCRCGHVHTVAWFVRPPPTAPTCDADARLMTEAAVACLLKPHHSCLDISAHPQLTHPPHPADVSARRACKGLTDAPSALPSRHLL
jgi:hypothetical protein